MAVALPSRYFSDLVETLERDLGLSARDLAGAVGVSQRTVERWRRGAVPQEETLKRLDALVELHHRLRESFKSMAAARSWLHRPNEYLRGMEPVDALRVGRPQQVHNALEIIDSGMFLYGADQRLARGGSCGIGLAMGWPCLEDAPQPLRRHQLPRLRVSVGAIS